MLGSTQDLPFPTSWLWWSGQLSSHSPLTKLFIPQASQHGAKPLKTICQTKAFHLYFVCFFRAKKRKHHHWILYVQKVIQTEKGSWTEEMIALLGVICGICSFYCTLNVFISLAMNVIYCKSKSWTDRIYEIFIRNIFR